MTVQQHLVELQPRTYAVFKLEVALQTILFNSNNQRGSKKPCIVDTRRYTQLLQEQKRTWV